MGPRTRPERACILSFGVSAGLISLLFAGRRCRAIATAPGVFFQALMFPAILYATRGAGSDMRGPGTAGGPVGRIKVFGSVLFPKAARRASPGRTVRATKKERSYIPRPLRGHPLY